jgi:hypothetical protein
MDRAEPYRTFTSVRLASSGMRLLAVVVLAGLVAVSGVAASPSAGSAPMRVTFVGDSVAESISYVSAARAELKHGLSVRLDLKVCRRLVQPSCSYQGSAPPTALQAVQSYGHSLGRVLIVKVGYNEGPQGYGAGIDRVMRAALAEGARGVVWVTLRESGPNAGLYRRTNMEIRKAGKRWRQLLVADWNAYSAGRPWFGSDGLHLSAEGAVRLAAFLRAYVLRAASLRA